MLFFTFLDAQHRLIEYQEMFRGRVTQTSVYPRDVVKESLALVDVRLIDHIVIGGDRHVSFAERGLL